MLAAVLGITSPAAAERDGAMVGVEVEYGGDKGAVDHVLVGWLVTPELALAAVRSDFATLEPWHDRSQIGVAARWWPGARVHVENRVSLDYARDAACEVCHPTRFDRGIAVATAIAFEVGRAAGYSVEAYAGAEITTLRSSVMPSRRVYLGLGFAGYGGHQPRSHPPRRGKHLSVGVGIALGGNAGTHGAWDLRAGGLARPDLGIGLLIRGFTTRDAFDDAKDTLLGLGLRWWPRGRLSLDGGLALDKRDYAYTGTRYGAALIAGPGVEVVSTKGTSIDVRADAVVSTIASRDAAVVLSVAANVY